MSVHQHSSFEQPPFKASRCRYVLVRRLFVRMYWYVGMGRGLDDGGLVGERRLEAAGGAGRSGSGGGVVECHNSPIPAEVDPGAKQPLAVRRPSTTTIYW